MAEKVFFSLGSNQGNRAGYLEKALEGLGKVCRELVSSRIWETAPLYYTRQPKYLNCVAAGFVSLSPQKLLSIMHGIEKRLGRVRRRRFGPRTIDIDLLLFGKRVSVSNSLQLPHPRIRERRFVLLPLLELEPALTDPVAGELYWKYLEKCGPGGVYFHSFSRYTKCSLKPRWTSG
jgi:2-amino-4-hydroxy-6-hydroxymethyldihydropteridine diphosphokinase